MGFLGGTVWKLFEPPPRDPFYEKSRSPKFLATPSPASASRFSLPSESSSASSSATSLASASSFWMSPVKSRWSPTKYLPSKVRNTVSKRQLAFLSCLLLALIVWILPPPATWRHQVVHVTVPRAPSNPYQVYRPPTQGKEKHRPDPLHWLEDNSNNKHAVSATSNILNSIPVYGQVSTKPRAALISLVRNSELQGLIQSMRQLEFQWNRKYQYPWIFFNDEPFSDEFKASAKLYILPCLANFSVGCYPESDLSQVLLRGRTSATLVPAYMDR